MKPHIHSCSYLTHLAIAAFGVLAALAPMRADAQLPLVVFTPLTATTITVPIDGVQTVEYELRNASNHALALVMNPIAGIHQVSSTGRCPSPFTLLPASSCVLELRVVGSEIAGAGVIGGPVVCVVSNPLMCYQPTPANALNVTVGPSSMAVLDATPCALFFAPAMTAMVVVTNTGNPSIDALNIQVDLPNGSAIVVDSGSCAGALAPGTSCNVLLSAGSEQPVSTVVIGGSNTNLVNVEVTVTDDVLFVNGFE